MGKSPSLSWPTLYVGMMTFILFIAQSGDEVPRRWVFCQLQHVHSCSRAALVFVSRYSFPCFGSLQRWGYRYFSEKASRHLLWVIRSCLTYGQNIEVVNYRPWRELDCNDSRNNNYNWSHNFSRSFFQLSAYYVTGTKLSALNLLSHLILTTDPWGTKYSYYLHVQASMQLQGSLRVSKCNWTGWHNSQVWTLYSCIISPPGSGSRSRMKSGPCLT